MTTLALEVLWAKELSYILGNTYYAVATVVAAFMTGLAIGSALAGRYGNKIKYPIKAYALMEIRYSNMRHLFNLDPALHSTFV